MASQGLAPQATAATTDIPQDAAASAPRAEGDTAPEERRERRSRDRYGRDRRERAERTPGEEAGTADASATPNLAEEATPPARPPRERRERFSPSDRQAETRAVEPTVDAPVAPATTARTGMPRIGSYELPVQSLSALAQSASMEWVQSNAERVGAVQAAIAAEPRPVHVPRERPAPVVLDEGPLILVETRKDLAQLNMPFEGPGAH